MRPLPPAPVLFAIAAASLAPTLALAQSPPATPIDAKPDSVQTLPSVVVTGEAFAYRAYEADTGALGNLPLLSTPFSVNVITRELLDNQQASFLGDFLKNDPSAAIGNVVVSFATLRGFSLGSDGFLVDGMRLGYPLSDGRVAMSAFERVDILKGASAFLYGLGSTGSLGGSLNYVPKAAPERPVRDVALTYDSRTQFGVNVDLGDRLGDDRQFGYRLNAGFRDGETAVDQMDWRQGFVSLVADWRLTRDLVLQGGFYYADNDFKNIQPFFVGASLPDGSPIIPIPAAPDTSKNIGPSWSRFGQEATIGWMRADWAFAPDWSLSFHYGAGRDDRPNSGTQDTRFGVLTSDVGDVLLFSSQERSRTDVQSLQALVHGKFATAEVKHLLTIGASGYEQKGYSNFQSAGVLPGNLYTGMDVPQPPNVPLDGMPYTGKTESSGVVISDILSVGEAWSLLIGGRQAKITNYDSSNTPIPGGEVSRFSPVGAVMYKPSAASLIYFNYAQGLEPGGTAPVDTVNANQIMPPLITKQYELGAKLDLDNLTLTAAIFDMERPLQFRDGDNEWVEDGDQRHRGIEFLAAGQLMPDLRVVGGFMYLDAKQKNTGSPLTDGKRVPGVPEWTANLYLDYRIVAVPGCSSA